MRYSLKTLLASFALIMVSSAALLYPNRIWAACFFTAILLMVLTGIVAALVRRGPARAYWIGFCVFAGTYFLLSNYGEVQLNRSQYGRVQSLNEPRLVSSQLLLWADDWLTKFRPAREFAISPGAEYMRSGPSPMTFVARGTTGQTQIIGHCVFTVLLALVGGAVADRLYRREGTAETGGA